MSLQSVASGQIGLFQEKAAFQYAVQPKICENDVSLDQCMFTIMHARLHMSMAVVYFIPNKTSGAR